MGIKLRTATDKRRGLVAREHEGIVNFRANVVHDAAVAHAREKALDCLPAGIKILYQAKTKKYLREYFGIEDKDNG